MITKMRPNIFNSPSTLLSLSQNKQKRNIEEMEMLYKIPKETQNRKTMLSSAQWQLKWGRIFVRENLHLILHLISAIRENLHLSRENLHSSQSPTSRPDSGWSSAHIDRPDSGWSSTHVDPSPSQRWSRHGNVDFEAKKHTRWRHYISNILIVNQWDWQWLSIWHYHSAWVRKHIFLNIWQ